jgi:hypothetical protein
VVVMSPRMPGWYWVGNGRTLAAMMNERTSPFARGGVRERLEARNAATRSEHRPRLTGLGIAPAADWSSIPEPDLVVLARSSDDAIRFWARRSFRTRTPLPATLAAARDGEPFDGDAVRAAASSERERRRRVAAMWALGR